MDAIKTKYRKMEKIIIRVLDYTENPGPRFIHQGAFSGEDFYRKVLNKKMAECISHEAIMEVWLDGTSGYPSSFLDQAFGELVYDFTEKEVRKIVHFETKMYMRRVNKLYDETYPQWEKRRLTEFEIHNGEDYTHCFYLNSEGKLSQRL